MYPNIKAEMARRSMTIVDLAKELGLSENTMCRKLNGGTDFWLSEVMAMRRVFNCSLDYLFSDHPIVPDPKGA